MRISPGAGRRLPVPPWRIGGPARGRGRGRLGAPAARPWSPRIPGRHGAGSMSGHLRRPRGTAPRPARPAPRRPPRRRGRAPPARAGCRTRRPASVRSRMLLPLNLVAVMVTRISDWNRSASFTNLSAGRRCRPRLLVISTWRRATGGSWLIGGSVGLGTRDPGFEGPTGLGPFVSVSVHSPRAVMTRGMPEFTPPNPGPREITGTGASARAASPGPVRRVAFRRGIATTFNACPGRLPRAARSRSRASSPGGGS